MFICQPQWFMLYKITVPGRVLTVTEFFPNAICSRYMLTSYSTSREHLPLKFIVFMHMSVVSNGVLYTDSISVIFVFIVFNDLFYST